MIQSPSSITVKEGDSAQITCCWSEIKHKVKVHWYIDQTRLSDVKQELYGPKTQNCSMLNFTNILKNATGLYVCEVTQDIPVLIQTRGSGTTLSVKDDQLETTTIGELLKDCHISFRSPGARIILIQIKFFNNWPVLLEQNQSGSLVPETISAQTCLLQVNIIPAWICGNKNMFIQSETETVYTTTGEGSHAT